MIRLTSGVSQSNSSQRGFSSFLIAIGGSALYAYEKAKIRRRFSSSYTWDLSAGTNEPESWR